MKIRILETYTHHWEIDSFSVKDFSDEIGGEIYKCDFSNVVNIYKICVIWWANIFHITRAWCYKIVHE